MTPLRQAWLDRQIATLISDMQSESRRTEAEALSRHTVAPEDVPVHTPTLNSIFADLDAVVIETTLKIQRGEGCGARSQRQNMKESRCREHTTVAKNAAVTLRLQSVAGYRRQADFYYRLASQRTPQTVCEVGFVR